MVKHLLCAFGAIAALLFAGELSAGEEGVSGGKLPDYKFVPLFCDWVQRDIYVTPMPKGLVSTRNSRKRWISRIALAGDWCRVVVAGLEALLRP